MNEEVLAALAKARWNESVRLDIEGDDGGDGDGETSKTTMILVPRLDRENGGVKWENAVADAAGEDAAVAEAAAHVRTKKWIFPMLHDQRRNDLYEKAIERASREAVRRFLEDDSRKENSDGSSTLRSLDIGSGTGLLAMLSEKYLSRALVDRTASAPPKQLPSIEVTSLEMAAPMADLAKRTVKLEAETKLKNSDVGSSNNTLPKTIVDVIEGHSCQIPSMAKSGGVDGAWLCTSELLESGLLAEGWLPALRDAWDRHLHPCAVVLPQRARLMARLVGGAAGFCGPHASLPLGGTDAVPIPSLRLFATAADRDDGDGSRTIATLSDGSYDARTGCKHGIQVEIHADRYLNGTTGNKNSDSDGPVLKILSDPIEALSVDVTCPKSIPDANDMHTRTKFFTPTASGRADGVLFWWDLDLYGDDSELTYSTEPGSAFQDHWHQCLYVFPYSSDRNGCGTQVERDVGRTLLVSHTDARVHFSIAGTEEDGARDSKRPKATPPPQSLPVVGPRRCRQLNDLDRSAKFRNGIRSALASIGADRADPRSIHVLDVSDFPLCGMMASLLGGDAVVVTSIESSSSGLPLAAARVAQIGNGLGTDHEFQIVRCHAESLTRDIVRGNHAAARDVSSSDVEDDGGGIVDLVVGEPYYEMLEGWPIETALNYFYTLRKLKANGIVRANALCVPARARVFACGIECADLGTAYRKRLSSTRPGAGISPSNAAGGSSVCGFDHTPLAECWNYDRRGIALPLWEYNGVVPVTEIVEVLSLDYETDAVHRPVARDDGTGPTLPAEFTEANRTCHAIAFWVVHEIRTSRPSDSGGPGTEAGASSDEPAFEKISTGFGACPGDGTSGSICAERQTVRILAREQRTVLGEHLSIPVDGLEI